MKKILSTIAILLTLVLSLCACNKAPLVIKESDTYIVITASSEQTELTADTTLVDYMNSLKADGELSFEIASGMITSINGIANASDWSSCWMLYTDDAESSNTAWGEIEYKGKVYGSSVSGAETLKIKNGCVYIWVYQEMQL